MSQSFQLVGIDHQQFSALFELTDEELEHYQAKRCYAAESDGFPCRITLEDAPKGEELLLLPFLHQPAASPYRSSGPIFVRRGVQQRILPIGEVSSYVTKRLMSVRAYDAAHMMVDATVCEGATVAAEILNQFRRPEVAYIHLHNARRGCFSCEVVRA